MWSPCGANNTRNGVPRRTKIVQKIRFFVKVRTGGVNLLCDGGISPVIQNATLACPRQGDEVQILKKRRVYYKSRRPDCSIQD